MAGLAVSAFFAASEGAFFQLSGPADGEPSERGSAAARMARLLERPERLQGAIELGHMLGVIWVTALAWVVARRFADYPAPLTWAVVVLAVGFVVVVVAELAPKALGMQRGAAWASRVALVVLAWRTLLTPVVTVAAAIGRVAERILPPVPQPSLDSEDIRTMVAETTERSELESGEREMISSIFAFGETTVREVMTPRTDLVAVEVSMPLSEIIALVRESERSRVPVYKETLDEIIGVVYAKDLLAIAHGLAEPPVRLKEILWEAAFVPEAKKIDDLLRQFQREQIHMAVVIDEYGGTAGIVTLEDILEELVGEIQDEYDVEEPLVVPMEDGVLRLDGRLDADDFNDFTGSAIDAEDVDTIGGLVARELARVAKHGDTVEIDDWVFEVETVEGKRITRLLAWPREEPAENGGGA
ncbi:MAG TPA: hemolysin family protein [Gemmatimonadota bacterium]|nr:hemolysin family protein [Gemmatimonadota bacterium]